MSLKTPVLFLLFNRPSPTQTVFNVIRQARPAQLYIAADGPRQNAPADWEKCQLSRRIIDYVDWDCEVITLFRDKNLGCRNAVSSAIDWFFSHVEEGIILEDDCLPCQSFFKYCSELLEYYRNDTRVMQICGFNFLKQWNRGGQSYFFSNYGPVWGWASWRRAWKYYDVDMKLWPELRENKLYEDFCQNTEEAQFRLALYDRIYAGKIDTWDYQWGFAKMINSGFSIIPASNLIKNIGFTDDATHTVVGVDSPYANVETSDIPIPLKHTKYLIRDVIADNRYVNEFMSIATEKSLIDKLVRLLVPRVAL